MRVHAASANAGDWHLLRGTPLPFRLVAGLIKPKYKVIGNDIAGTVEAVGRNVTQFKPGDGVFGEVSRYGFGAYAEYVVARENALALKPVNLSFEEAASVSTSGCTALQGRHTLCFVTWHPGAATSQSSDRFTPPQAASRFSRSFSTSSRSLTSINTV